MCKHTHTYFSITKPCLEGVQCFSSAKVSLDTLLQRSNIEALSKYLLKTKVIEHIWDSRFGSYIILFFLLKLVHTIRKKMKSMNMKHLSPNMTLIRPLWITYLSTHYCVHLNLDWVLELKPSWTYIYICSSRRLWFMNEIHFSVMWHFSSLR